MASTPAVHVTMAGTLRGALIVLEGLDRTGKTTQGNLLLEALRARGVHVQALRFPDRTSVTGKLLTEVLTGKTQLPAEAVHLLFSANRWEAQEHMRSLLRQGTTLVVDRYSYSGIAYSHAKGLDMDWCARPDKGLLAPDLVLFLDIDPEVAQKREGYGEEVYERVDFQRRVRDGFRRLSDRSWQVVDAARSIDEIHEEMLKHATACLRTLARDSLQYI